MFCLFHVTFAGTLTPIFVKYGRMFPTKRAVRLPKFPIIVNSKIMLRILFLFYNIIPAFLVDLFLKLSGSKPLNVMKITRDIFYFMNVCNYYDKTFSFDCRNMLKVYNTMTPGDNFYFPCSMPMGGTENYIMKTIDGIRKYFLKETDADLVEARAKMKVLYFIDCLFDVVFASVPLYFIYLAMF